MYWHTTLKSSLAMAVFALVATGAGSKAQAEEIQTVFVIAMENHNWTQPSPLSSPQQILGNVAAPYINSLVTPGNPNAAQVSFASNYQNVGAGIHPSEPNYIWAEAGSNLGVLNDNDPYTGGTNQTTLQSLSNYLQIAGHTWKSYQEDTDINLTNNVVLPQSQWTVPLTSHSGTFSSGVNAYNGSNEYNYAAKHNPMVIFSSTNGGNNSTPSNPLAVNYAPLQQFATDLANNIVAQYNWITPDQYNEQHSSLSAGFTYNGVHYTGDQAAVAEGDSFLSMMVPQIMASQAYKNNGVIILWWDESEGGDTSAYTLGEIVISPLAKGNAYTNTIKYTHSSDLLTMQELFGVGPCLRDACNATDLSDLFVSGAIPSGIVDPAIHFQVQNTSLVYPGSTPESVCVTPATSAPATGTVRILDASTTILAILPLQGNSCANWYVNPPLSAGTHSLSATYSGDSNNPDGTSAPVTVTVSPTSSYLQASCGNAGFVYSGNYNCNVNVGSEVGGATGSITYTFDGGTPVSLPLSNGSAQFSWTTPNAGPHTVVIGYAQQGNFAAAGPNTENFTVAPATTKISLSPSDYYPPAGSSLTLSASVTSYSAAPPTSGTVTFYANGISIGTGPVNAQGLASLTIPSLAAGYYSFNAQFGGLTPDYGAAGSNYLTIQSH